MSYTTLKTTPPQSPEGFTFDLQRFDSTFGGGSGTEADPYQIASVADLQQLANDVNGGTDYSGVYFKLTANIDLSTVSNWTPIGTYISYKGIPFSGTFDGTGYTISNLTITGSNSYLGLFGDVGEGGTVQNVTLNTVNVSGNSDVGALVGQNEGGTISGCTVINATVTGTDWSIGGLVGENYNGSVSGNTVIATVTTSSTQYDVGGVVGFNYSGTVGGNYYYGDANAVGENNGGTVSGNTRLSTLTVPTGITAEYTGGDDYKLTIGGTIYYKSGATFKLTVSNTPAGKYLQSATRNADGTYTYTVSNLALAWVDIPTIDGLTFDSSINGYTISTVAQLQAVAAYVNAGNNCAGLTFKLSADINLTGVSWTPIGSFSGTFDGNGHTISNLSVSGDNVGLFGVVGEGGTITNVTIKDASASTSNKNAAALVGVNYGTVTNCTVSGGTVSGWTNIGGVVASNYGTVTNCTVTATVTGSYYIGGVVGENEGGTVTNCTVTGTVNSDSSYGGGIVGMNSGTVSGNTVSGTVGGSQYIGGVVGNNYGGTVSDNTVSGEVSGNNTVGGLVGSNYGTVSDNTVSGSVTGNQNVGGLVGYNSGTVSNATVSGSVTGTSTVGGLVGENDGSVSDNTVVGAVTGTSTVGGLVGENYDGSVSGNKYYTNQTKEVGTIDDGTVENNSKLYKLTLPSGVTVTSDTLTVDGTTYYTDPITLTIGAGAALVGVTSVDNVAADSNGTVSITLTNSDVSIASSNIYYSISGTDGLNVSGGSPVTVSGTNYYASGSSVTLSTGTGAIIGAATATGGNLTDNNDGTWTLTTTTAASTVNPTLYYALTLPDNVTASGGTSKTVDGVTYYAGNVTLSATASNAVIRSTSYTNNTDGTVSFTPAAATDFSNDLTFYYTVSIPNCVDTFNGTSITVSGTNYYQNGSTLNLTAKTGYTLNSTSVTVSSDTSITATVDTTNHYAFNNGDGYTYATDDNVATSNYPDLTQVYELTLPESVTASGDICVTDNGTTYAVGSVTLSAAAGYTLQNVKVDGTTYDGNTLTVSAATTILADSIKFNNTNISKATGAEVGGTTGDLHAFSSVYSISASQNNSTLVGNAKNNTVILTGGGENILTGGGGNDTYKFESGGGIVTDFGIGATKSSDGKALEAPLGTDVIKLNGTVSGVYFDRAASNKNSANFTAVVTYDSDGDSTADQVVVLKDIIKKPTKYGSKPVFQTNDVAAATMKIWDTSGSKQAVLSASKLKTLFHDDSELTDDLKTQLTTLSTNLGIGDLNLPAVDALNQTAQATYSGSND